MTTLFTATLELAKILREVYEGVATGGGATTLTDTALVENPDYYKNGTIWLLSGTGVANKARVVSDFNASGPIFTFATVTSSVVAGVRYAVTTDRFPWWMLRQAINSVIREYGLPSYDTTLTTVADQVEYALPSGVANVLRVEIGQQTTEPYGWQQIDGWHELNGVLYFDDYNLPIAADMPIRLKYLDEQTELVNDSDVIPTMFPLPFLKWAAAVDILRIKYQKPEDDVATQWQEALRMKGDMENRYGIDKGAKPDLSTSGLLQASDRTT